MEPPTITGAHDVSLLTVSYRGDLGLARELCRSVDRYLDPAIEHLLVVSRVDAALFEPLRSDRRRIVIVDDVLPPGYRRIPAPQEIRIGRLHRRIREMWLTPAGLARGWIVQQIVKLAAPSYCDREVIVFADSDIELTSAFGGDRLVFGGQARLYRVPGATADSDDHVRWHRVAAQMLGMEPDGYLGSDYIGNLITWRRSVLLLLQEAIARNTGRRWDKAVASRSAFSEYILYGVFVEHVLGGARSGHLFTTEDLVHAGWFYDLATSEGLSAFMAGMAPHQVGVAIQSTEELSLADRRRIIDATVEGRDRRP